jgi:FlaA1/EpsC-like NDP-sugar epimerase
MKYIDNKTLLVTGGTGSWGHELVSQLLSLPIGPREIRVYSRNEHKQVEMRAKFPDRRLRFIIGDVRDKNILNLAMKKVDTIFHLAALKHVPICEDNPWEAVLTNIYGTQNIIEGAIANEVEVVVDVSTDKAVESYNLYGVTKAAGEKLIVNANKFIANTRFVCIRGGNVIGTNGSVIPLFKKQLSETNEITITDPTMTRFLMSTKEAIGLLFKAIQKHSGGEIFVLHMPAATVGTIADSMILLFGNKKSKKRIVGIRQGEKKHEVLISRNEIPFTEDTSDSYFTIHPSFGNITINKPLQLPEFSSQTTEQLTAKKLVELLKKEAWLFA